MIIRWRMDELVAGLPAVWHLAASGHAVPSSEKASCISSERELSLRLQSKVMWTMRNMKLVGRISRELDEHACRKH